MNDDLNEILFDENLVGEEVMAEIRSMRYLDAKILIGVAVGLGWHWQRAKAFHFISHDGIKVDIPTNTALNAKVFRSRVNTLVRHRDPKSDLHSAVEQIIAHPNFKVDPDRARVLREAVASALPVESTPAPISGGNHEPESVPVAAAPTRRKVRVTKEEPWSAHRNAKGETYPSEAVMERVWSNDTTDYACRWEGCDFTDDSPRSVAAHYGPAHRHGEGIQPQAEVDGIDPTWVTNPRRATRIRNLAREIDGAFGAAFSEGIALDPDWLAQWIIDHRIEALPSDTPVPAEPLSTEEILDKIAALVDRGRGKVLREQVDILQRQVDGYIDERDHVRDTMQDALDAANERASKAEGYVQALRDLINETQGS
jgi:hypothetical protein